MKSYEKLELELIKFSAEDVIRTSGWEVEEEGGNQDTGDHGTLLSVDTLSLFK